MAPPTQKEERKNMPFGVLYGHTLILSDQVYIGGGDTTRGNSAHIIYLQHSGEWSWLPKCTVCYFPMVSVKDQLVVKGTALISNYWIVRVIAG